jgi:hypothetical protein
MTSNNLFYPGLELLTEGDIILKKQKNIILCAYEINNDGLYPYLSYLLFKREDQTLEFPSFTLPKKCDSVSTFINKSIVEILQRVLAEDISKMEYDGYFTFRGSIYVFYDLSHCMIVIPNVLRMSTMWFGLIDEIVNLRHVCNFKVNSQVVDFFLNNPTLLFLEDENNISYEIPTVAYVGKNNKCLNFTYVFGETIDENGNYNFTNYENAMKQSSSSGGGGLVRFALFLKNNSKEYHPNFTVETYEQQTPLSFYFVE